jgi:hypothetical protein
MRARPMMIVASLSIAAAGCIDSTRVNTTCTWSESSATRLDLSRAADREHLRMDAKLAGELGVRIADVRYRNSPEPEGRLMRECRNALIDTIIAKHGVTSAEVDRAVTARVVWADVLCVYLPIALLTFLVMDSITRRICRWFAADDRRMAMHATAFFVPIVAAIAVGVAQFWSFAVESWFLRNEHVSFRAFEIPVMMHGWIALFATLAISSLAAVRRLRVTPLTGTSGAGRYAPRFR